MALAEARPVSLALADGAARHSFARITEVAPIPNLIKVQRDSFEWFLREGLKELFAEISPIQDFTGRNMDLELAVPGPDAEPAQERQRPIERRLARAELVLADRQQHDGRGKAGEAR